MNSSAQHIVNTVEVEKPEIIELTEIIKMTVQRKKLIIQEKINQGTKPIEFPLAQFTDKVVVTCPVVVQTTGVHGPDSAERVWRFHSRSSPMSKLYWSCNIHWCRSWRRDNRFPIVAGR